MVETESYFIPILLKLTHSGSWVLLVILMV